MAKRLGELLVDEGLVSQETIDRALKMQVGGARRLGTILVKMGAIDEDQRTTVLARQLNLPIIDPDQTFSASARGVLPRYLCKKYDIFPVSCEEEDVLHLAMSDPSDNEAIASVEEWTNKAVQPCLAHQANIQQAIRRHVPFSRHDFFSPQSYLPYARFASGLALVLVLAVTYLGSNFYIEWKYGTVSKTANAVIYEHLDLVVDIDKGGQTALSGRGAYAEGRYGVSFKTTEGLAKFIQNKKTELSTAQYDWIQWVLKRAM